MGRLPVFKKCFFCIIPLRSGLLVWGYIKLVSVALILSMSRLIIHVLREYLIDYQRGVGLVYLILLVETIEHIVLIIGAHKKNVALLQMYFLYAIYILVTLIVLCVSCTVLIFVTTTRPSEKETRSTLLLANFLSHTAGFLIQSYIVLAVRSEIIKLRSNCSYTHVKETQTIECGIESKRKQQCDDKVILIDNDNNITVRNFIILDVNSFKKVRQKGGKQVCMSRCMNADEAKALSFRLTQVLSGHGCFGKYLCRIGREPSPGCHH